MYPCVKHDFLLKPHTYNLSKSDGYKSSQNVLQQWAVGHAKRFFSNITYIKH